MSNIKQGWNYFDSKIESLWDTTKLALYFLTPELRNIGYTGKLFIGGKYINPSDYLNMCIFNSDISVVYMPRQGGRSTIAALMGAYLIEHNAKKFGGFISPTYFTSRSLESRLKSLGLDGVECPFQTINRLNVDRSKIYILDQIQSTNILDSLKEMGVQTIAFIDTSKDNFDWASKASCSYLKVPAQVYPDALRNVFKNRVVDILNSDEAYAYTLGINLPF